MPETDISELEILFLALNDKTRLRLLALMASGPVSVGYLVDSLGESQPKVSRHLAYMRNAGIVNTRRDGKWIFYGIEYPRDASLREIMETVVNSVSTGTARKEARPVATKSRARKKTQIYNTYGKADIINANIYAEPDINEDIAEIVGPIDEEMFYGSEPSAEPEDDLDVFLL